MRKKVMIWAIIIAIASLMISTLAFAANIDQKAAEQTILRLLYDSAQKAVNDYYGEVRQFRNAKILSIEAIPNSPYYKVIMQVETFYGPHNPPYGIETMTFYVMGGKIELRNFEHQDKLAKK